MQPSRTASVMLAAGALLVSGASVAPAAAATRAGSIDTTFGSRGLAYPPEMTHGGPSVVGQDRRMWQLGVAAGGRLWLTGTQGESDYTAKLTPNGAADPAFHGGTPRWRSGDLYMGNQNILGLPDGGAIVIWNDWDNEPNGIYAYRLSRTGHIVTSWGDHGDATLITGSDRNELLAVQLRADGGLRFVGTQQDEQPGSPPHLVVGALSPSGAPDTSAVAGGLADVAGIPDGLFKDVTAATFDASGRAYVLNAPVRLNGCDSTCSGHPYVGRVSVAGALDTGYGDHGQVALPMGGAKNTVVYGPGPTALSQSLVASSSGELYVAADERSAGTGRLTGSLWHVRPAGRIDPGFGTDGLARFAARGGDGTVSAIEADGQGHLVLGLTYSDADRFSHLLLRVSARTAAPDSTFGAKGAVAVPFLVFREVRQSTDRLVVLGQPTKRAGDTYGSSRLIRYVL